MLSAPVVVNCTFAFECPRKWKALRRSPDKKVRRCTLCSREVHLVENAEEWKERTEKGDCIALRAPVRGAKQVGQPGVPQQGPADQDGDEAEEADDD